jgi:hypothetical protein
MTSSNRAAAVLSIFSAVSVLTGCPDPQGTFDNYVAKLPDAPVVVTYDSPPLNEIPDVTGTFLLAIKVAFVPQPLQAIATVTMTKNGTGATMSFHVQWLAVDTRDLVTRLPFDLTNVVVDSAGTFTANVGTLVIPMEGNPLGVDATAENVTQPGQIQTKDRFCGTVTGMVTSPTPAPLTGSTFGAIRVQAGQTGSQLPDPLLKCPAPADGGP